QEKLPPGAKLVHVQAFPQTVNLHNPYDYDQVILVGQLETRELIDVTRLARFEVPDSLASITPSGLIRPVADGNGELKCTVEGQAVSVPLTVPGLKQTYPVSFGRDVMPALSKMGCNAGTCHGSAQGKNGFKLSLRGYDAFFDHMALTDDVAGRRFNRAA